MRMNIKARAVASAGSDLLNDCVTLTLQPSVSLPGDYSFTINIEPLRSLLRRTDLSFTSFKQFDSGLWNAKGASLLRWKWMRVPWPNLSTL
jgi:hypothetical protein